MGTVAHQRKLEEIYNLGTIQTQEGQVKPKLLIVLLFHNILSNCQNKSSIFSCCPILFRRVDGTFVHADVAKDWQSTWCPRQSQDSPCAWSKARPRPIFNRAHNMVSRIFRIRIYEYLFFLVAVQFCFARSMEHLCMLTQPKIGNPLGAPANHRTARVHGQRLPRARPLIELTTCFHEFSEQESMNIFTNISWFNVWTVHVIFQVLKLLLNLEYLFSLIFS